VGIDEEGGFRRVFKLGKNIDTRILFEKYGLKTSLYHPTFSIFGLIRRKDLMKTPLFQEFVGSDTNLLVEIGMRGRIHIIRRYLFYRRSHPEAYTEKRFKSYQETVNWWSSKLDKVQARSRQLLTVSKARSFFRKVNRGNIGVCGKMFCIKLFCDWFLSEGLRYLYTDLEREIFLRSDLLFKIIWIIKRRYIWFTRKSPR
jgi:hypothetical protein